MMRVDVQTLVERNRSCQRVLVDEDSGAGRLAKKMAGYHGPRNRDAVQPCSRSRGYHQRHSRLKDIRATAASTAKESGFSEEQVKAGLAHTDLKSTRDYLRVHEAPSVSEIVVKLPT